MISVTINGEKREISEQLTLTQLLQNLELPLERIAVELNLEVTPRQNWETTKINDGDKLEIVHFVGGGTDTVQSPKSQVPSPKSKVQSPKSQV